MICCTWTRVIYISLRNVYVRLYGMMEDGCADPRLPPALSASLKTSLRPAQSANPARNNSDSRYDGGVFSSSTAMAWGPRP